MCAYGARPPLSAERLSLTDDGPVTRRTDWRLYPGCGMREDYAIVTSELPCSYEDNDFERAQELMVEWEASDPDIAAAIIRCPQCGSSQIEYPQLTRKAITPAMASVLFALKMFPKEFYCEDCHYTWTKDQEG